MVEVVGTAADLRLGSHALSLHSSREEAESHAVSFLKGAPTGQPASYWVESRNLAEEYTSALRSEDPTHVGCVGVLSTEQVEYRDGRLRPISAVFAFIEQHPEGVSGGADTISSYWDASNVDAHLEYEAWFDDQPKGNSRFICPYDLRRLPAEHAEAVLRELGSHHGQVVLSESPEPAVRLLQLFIFPTLREIPSRLQPDLFWALSLELVTLVRSPYELDLTEEGDDIVKEWSARATVP